MFADWGIFLAGWSIVWAVLQIVLVLATFLVFGGALCGFVWFAISRGVLWFFDEDGKEGCGVDKWWRSHFGAAVETEPEEVEGYWFDGEFYAPKKAGDKLVWEAT